MIQIFNLTKQSDKPGLFELGSGRQRASLEIDSAVKPILEAIRRDGDEALISFARELDGLDHQSLRVSQQELEKAAAAMSPEVKKAVEAAVTNIRQFAEAQLPKERFEEFSPGRKLGGIVRPLDAVGCYVPSGRYPLPSTLLMTAVLAQTAGVKRICVTSPRPSLEILGCAHMLGIQEVFRVGGAQAIAAKVTGLPLDQVTVHNHLSGGGFGRRLEVEHDLGAEDLAHRDLAR